MRRDAISLFPSIDSMAARPALRVGDDSLDYSALATTCALFRRAMAEIGIGREDRIAIWAHPDLESIVGLIGSVSAGITTIPLNPDTGEKELAHILADAKPRAI